MIGEAMPGISIRMGASTVPGVPLPCERELLEEAMGICRQRLVDDPTRARELNLLGLLAARLPAHDLSVACITRAAQFEPTNVEYLGDMASALERGGRYADAMSAALRALTCDPEGVEMLRVLARCLHRRQELVGAAAMYAEYLQRRPDDAAAMADMADVRRDQGRQEEAIAGYETSLQAEPSCRTRADLHGRIGAVHLAGRDWAQALAAFGQGLLLDEGRAELHYGAGRALMGLGRYDEAVAASRDALNIEPMHAEAASQLVCALELLSRTKDGARAWLHLGHALEARSQYAEASAAFRHALARKPDCLEALLRLGNAQLMQEKPAEAIAPLRAGLAIAPDHIGAHFQLGCALQLTGDWEGGWNEFGWLSHERRIKAWRVFEQPRWDGASAEGKAMLVWAGLDYGLGDTLHLVRFVRHLKRRHVRVIVECQPELVSIISRMPDVDQTVPRGAPLPAFDMQAPMMWVPVVDRDARALRDSDVPYLSVEPALVERWRERLPRTSFRRVGLCWAGAPSRRDAHLRFASLTTFGPLAEVPGVHFVSLQMGPQADDLFCPPGGLEVERVLHEASSIDDTAAAISHLDLVITVDTMVAHLAGALGKPVWTILRYAAEWRWLAGETTVWYPTMRLFRPRTQTGWTEVIEDVRLALAEWSACATRRD